MSEINHAQSSKNNNKPKSEIRKYSIESGIFTGDYKNDGVSGEFDGLMYKHSKELSKVFEVLVFLFIM